MVAATFRLRLVIKLVQKKGNRFKVSFCRIIKSMVAATACPEQGLRQSRISLWVRRFRLRLVIKLVKKNCFKVSFCRIINRMVAATFRLRLIISQAEACGYQANSPATSATGLTMRALLCTKAVRSAVSKPNGLRRDNTKISKERLFAGERKIN
jgi:hypothetical protein